MKRKPKWWNIDWVELGCRDINVEGACYGEQKAMRARFDSCFVHLDRDTLGLHIHGHRLFVARVLADLIAAGVLRMGPSMTWLTADNTTMTSGSGSTHILRLAS